MGVKQAFIANGQKENPISSAISHDNCTVIDTMNDDGTLSEAAGLYIGQDRIEVRKIITKDLEAAGNLVKIEDYTHQVGFSERTDAIV